MEDIGRSVGDRPGAVEGLGVAAVGDMNPFESDSSFWRGRPVFVPGAAGLLGSWLTAALLDRGASVVTLIRDWTPDNELVCSGNLARVCIVRGDVRDQETMERVPGEYEIDTGFHLSSQTIVGIANRHPTTTREP